jgi:hypothetical protein
MPTIVNDTSYYYPDSGLFEPAVSYGDGMFWRATAAGTINATVYAIGDIIYSETTAENVAAGDVVWKVLSENTSIVGGFRIDAAGNANFGPNFKVDGPTGTVTIGGNNAANLATTAGTVSAGGAAADINANVTTIAGGKISTGNIRSTNYDAADTGEIFADAGTDLNLNDGIIKSQHLVVDASGVSATNFKLFDVDTKRAEWSTALNGNTYDGFIFQSGGADYSYIGAKTSAPDELRIHSGGASSAYMILDGGFSIIANANKSNSISTYGLMEIKSTQSQVRLVSNSMEFWGGTTVRAGAGLIVHGPNYGEVGSKGWSVQQFRINSDDTSGDVNSNAAVGMSFWNQRYAIAPILRNHGAEGEQMGFVNNPNSAFVPVRALSFTVMSTERGKKDLEWVEDDKVIDLAEKWLMAEFKDKVAPQSLKKTERFKGLDRAWQASGKTPLVAKEDHFESMDHVCTGEDSVCDGTAENPCPITRNFTRRFGGLAEWWGEVAPEQTEFDVDGIAAAINVDQVAATALGAAGSLSRRLNKALERIEALEQALAV